MKTKKVITGTAVAKAALMAGTFIMLIALLCNLLFDFAKESRYVFLGLLLSCSSLCYSIITGVEKHKKPEE